MEQSLIIIKPDAVNRGIVGEILHRFERKGLEIAAIKMVSLKDEVLNEHYAHHRDKPFFQDLKKFMMESPTIVIVLEGNNVIEIVRKMAGPTQGKEAPPGTIRGDYSMSHSHNIIHASDSSESAKKEIKRFFKPEEIFSYQKIDWEMVYAEDER